MTLSNTIVITAGVFISKFDKLKRRLVFGSQRVKNRANSHK